MPVLIALSLLLGTARAESDCTPPAIDALVRQAETRFADRSSDLAPIVSAVAEAERSLACADGVILPHQLAALFYTGAYAAKETDKRDLAKRWCASAARMAPDVPIPGPLYGALATTCAGTADVQSTGVVLAHTALHLDGVPLQATAKATVASGAHLLQVVDDSGSIASSLLLVRPDQETPTGKGRPGSTRETAKKGKKNVPLLASGIALCALGAGAMTWAALGPAPSAGAASALDNSAEFTTKVRQSNLLLTSGAIATGAGLSLSIAGAW